MLRELRENIANALAEEKAYNLPAVCIRLGLAPGDQSEAFASKRTYVLKRVADLGKEALMALAERVLVEQYSFQLDEQIQKMKEHGQAKLSPLTRQRLTRHLSEVDLGGKLGIVEFLARIWPLDAFPVEDFRCLTFVGEIQQHMLLNDDWDSGYLLQRLGIDDCSEKRFLRLLEEMAHPLVREGNE